MGKDFFRQVDCKAEDLLPGRMAERNFERFCEAIAADDEIADAVYQMVFNRFEDMADVREMESRIKSMLISYLGSDFETECQEAVHADERDHLEYMREIAAEDQYQSRKDDDFMWRTA
jgi:hypothetical protein